MSVRLREFNCLYPGFCGDFTSHAQGCTWIYRWMSRHFRPCLGVYRVSERTGKLPHTEQSVSGSVQKSETPEHIHGNCRKCYIYGFVRWREQSGNAPFHAVVFVYTTFHRPTSKYENTFTCVCVCVCVCSVLIWAIACGWITFKGVLKVVSERTTSLGI